MKQVREYMQMILNNESDYVFINDEPYHVSTLSDEMLNSKVAAVVYCEASESYKITLAAVTVTDFTNADGNDVTTVVCDGEVLTVNIEGIVYINSSIGFSNQLMEYLEVDKVELSEYINCKVYYLVSDNEIKKLGGIKNV